MILGDGKIGEALTLHEKISKVSFTGSVPVGKKIMANCAQSLKKITLELGGKSPLIIFEDCDIDKAVTGAMMANFVSQGQVCTNGTRVYVHEKILHSLFLPKLLENIKNNIQNNQKEFLISEGFIQEK